MSEWAGFFSSRGKKPTGNEASKQMVQASQPQQPVSPRLDETRGERRIRRGPLILLSLILILIALETVTFTSLLDKSRQYENLRDEYYRLRLDYDALKTDYEKLNSDYNGLEQSYQGLKFNFSVLNENYERLRSNHDFLEQTYIGLKAEYQTVLHYYRKFSDKLSELYEMFLAYHIPEAFKRCLNDEEIRNTAPVVSLFSDRSDPWTTYEKIYNYIKSNINYAFDIDMPCLEGVLWRPFNSSGYYLIDYTVGTINDYAQPPSVTLKYKQGDCEDQAILAYAMITYYHKYIYEKELTLYIAAVFFQDDVGHAAVIISMQNGQICIIDPPGNHLTSKSDSPWGTHRITSGDAITELNAYSNHWLTHGGIKSIKLFNINVSDGSYTVAASGSLSEIASFLSKS